MASRQRSPKWAGLHAIPNFPTVLLGIVVARWLPSLSLVLYALMPIFFIIPNRLTNRFLKGSRSTGDIPNESIHVSEPDASTGGI